MPRAGKNLGVNCPPDGDLFVPLPSERNETMESQQSPILKGLNPAQYAAVVNYDTP